MADCLERFLTRRAALVQVHQRSCRDQAELACLDCLLAAAMRYWYRTPASTYAYLRRKWDLPEDPCGRTC